MSRDTVGHALAVIWVWLRTNITLIMIFCSFLYFVIKPSIDAYAEDQIAKKVNLRFEKVEDGQKKNAKAVDNLKDSVDKLSRQQETYINEQRRFMGEVKESLGISIEN